MKLVIMLLAAAFIVTPLTAQGHPVGIRPAVAVPTPRGALFNGDPGRAGGVGQGMEIGAGVGAGTYMLLFLMFGRGGDGAGFNAGTFMSFTVISALIGGIVGAVTAGY